MKFEKGQKIKLKSLEEVKEDKTGVPAAPGLVPEMHKRFGTEVTFNSFTEKGYLIIEEDVYFYLEGWVDTGESKVTQKDLVTLLEITKDLTVRTYLKNLIMDMFGKKEFEKLNPELYSFLKGKGVLAEFFERCVKSGNSKIFSNKPWANCSLISEFVWVDNWRELHIDFVKTKNRLKVECTYHFVDSKFDFSKLCIDTLEDGKSNFLVVSKVAAFVGYLKTSTERIDYNPGEVLYDDIGDVHDLPFQIHKIPLDEVEVWKGYLYGYSKMYSSWKKDLDTFIKDRNRDKTHSTKVTVFTY